MGLKEVLEEYHGKPMRELLFDLYITKDYGMAKVAEELHIGQGTVHKWLHDYNIHKTEKVWNNKLLNVDKLKKL